VYDKVGVHGSERDTNTMALRARSTRTRRTLLMEKSLDDKQHVVPLFEFRARFRALHTATTLTNSPNSPSYANNTVQKDASKATPHPLAFPVLHLSSCAP